MAPLNISGIFVPALMSTILRSRVPPMMETVTPLESYDYVIIGSGFGGSVVANRLSEDASNSVLLLEAGDKDNVTSQIPLMGIAMIKGTYDWMYRTVPQKKMCFGAEDKVCNLPAGKVIGGTSVLDMMSYIRGSPHDYDEWEQLGNMGWSYEYLLPYFKKSEDFHVSGECEAGNYHSCGGELYLSTLSKDAEMGETEMFLKAVEEKGYSYTDFNGKNFEGSSRAHFAIRKGVRQSAATAFLRPVMKRRNFHISLNSFVTKILIDPTTKKATGVEYEKNGKIHQVKAKSEVILSAGVYGSPKILMQSGIGPKEELEKHNIPLIAEVPGVGENLREKISAVILFTTGNTLTEEQQSIVNTDTLRKWIKGEGVMTSPAGFDSFAFMKTKYAENSNRPDIMVLFQSLPMYSITESFLQRAFGISDEVWKDTFETGIDKESVTLHPTLLRPKSKGTVKLRSSNPHDLPLIDPNYYDDEEDLHVLVEAVHLTARLENTTAFQEKGYSVSRFSPKECSHLLNRGISSLDEFIRCALRYGTLTKWCGCCTNKMGPATDSMAVVDGHLRVRGVKGLRVVDASVFPEQTSGSPTAAVIAVAEKAADMIKDDNLA